jgi:very-short-patch-repair endonuclease
MPKRSGCDLERLRRVLQAQYQVVTRRQAQLCGMPESTLDRYVAPGGRWQRLLPGVYLTVTGTATQQQREMAALLYAGPQSLITGAAAVRRHHLNAAGPGVVDVLIPINLKRQSVGFVRVHRTRLMPERIYVTGQIRFTKPARAVADAARTLSRFDDVRQVVCDAVQRRACTVAELTEELSAGPAKGSALFREALAEVDDGVRSVAEADARRLILRSELPRPMFNARLYDQDDVFIAMVDAWWEEAGVAAEIDSRAYHLTAGDQDRTTERHDKLSAHGILVLHFPPARLKADPQGVINDLKSAIEQGRSRPKLKVQARPADS